MGATNRPQELDEAARRRFVKRLYIPLPEKPARLQILQNILKTVSHNITKEQLNEIANLTEGYSGADMDSLIGEAAMGPIRSISATQIDHIDVNEVNYFNLELKKMN